MLYRYFTFGLEIESEIKLPELLVSTRLGPPDLSISIGQAPVFIANATFKEAAFEVAVNQFLLNVKDIARFYVKDGNLIVIEPEKHSNESDIRLFLLGTCFGTILHQRKLLPLHASAIVHEGKAVLFSGNSGAGKSTTANAFRLEGYKMLTDDVCPIQFIDSKPFAIPGYPQSKLCEDALVTMGIDYQNLPFTDQITNKRKVAIHNNFLSTPIEVKAIYILYHAPNILDVQIESIIDADKFLLIKSMTYRNTFIKDLGIQSDHFQQSMKLSNQIPIKIVSRPQSPCLNTVVELIAKDLDSI